MSGLNYNHNKVKLIDLIKDLRIAGEYTESPLERTLVINTMVEKINEQSEFINAIITGIEREKERLHYLEVPKEMYGNVIFQLESLETILKPLRELELTKKHQNRSVKVE